MNYICLQDLFHKNGQKSFTKDKVYPDLSKGKIKGAAAFIDETNTIHGVCDVKDENGNGAWFLFFKSI